MSEVLPVNMKASWQILGVLALAACAPPPLEETPPSFDLAKYYAAAEQEIRARGGMRTDFAPGDARFTRSDLARDFMRIALFDEFEVGESGFVANPVPSNLRRFERPVVVRVINGASADSKTRQTNSTMVAKYTRNLADITGYDIHIALPGERANMLVFFLNRAEQPRIARQLGRYVTAPPRYVEDAFANSPDEMLCGAFSLANRRAPDSYRSSLILVKAEHSVAQRNACVQEEMAQALGLTNDSPDARPSIFNDDEEFVALTLHDAYLLKILYDKRLRAGMTAAQVRPLLPVIIEGIWPK
ncbi:MAG: DUF2927 domain-containing protein [Rhodobacteraceae bacterium]|nr:DUF2927 domain-containing protein [Paracoccaceae bacterium]